MRDETVDEVSVSFRRDRTLLKWRYADGPYFYRWFDL